MIISELMTGRVMKTYAFPAVIQEIRWNPSPLYADVIAVASETEVYLIDTELSGNADVHRRCRDLLFSRRREKERVECRGVEWLVNKAAEQIDESNENKESNESNENKESNEPTESKESSVFVDIANIVVLRHSSPVKDMAWHHKGDYFCVNASSASASIVYIHQLSKGSSQIPISKLKGLVQRVLFSPSSLPYLFVATQTEVKIYNLVKQTLVNKLRTGVKWVSSMAVRERSGFDRRSIRAETISLWGVSMRDCPGSISIYLPRPTKRCGIIRRLFGRCSSTISTL